MPPGEIPQRPRRPWTPTHEAQSQSPAAPKPTAKRRLEAEAEPEAPAKKVGAAPLVPVKLERPGAPRVAKPTGPGRGAAEASARKRSNEQHLRRQQMIIASRPAPGELEVTRPRPRTARQVDRQLKRGFQAVPEAPAKASGVPEAPMKLERPGAARTAEQSGPGRGAPEAGTPKGGDEEQQSRQQTAAASRMARHYDRQLKRGIQALLESTRPGLRISTRAMESVVGDVHTLVHALSEEAARIACRKKTMAVSSKEAEAAIRSLLPPELASEAVARGRHPQAVTALEPRCA